MSESIESNLLAVERQRIIREILQRDGVVRSTELHELLNVSMVTVRSDLRELEKLGECKLIWGGAVSASPAIQAETQLTQRSRHNSEEKKRIGARAAELVEPGQTIIVDAGTTTVELIHHLPPSLDYLRVITPALNVASAAAHYPQFELVMPGGVLRNLTRSLIGSEAAQGIEKYNADWTFLSSSSFALNTGITVSNIHEVQVKRAMVRQGQRVVLLADSSKFGRNAAMNVVDLSAIGLIITDTRMSDSAVTLIQNLGVEVWRV